MVEGVRRVRRVRAVVAAKRKRDDIAWALNIQDIVGVGAGSDGCEIRYVWHWF
jgi:hypothetical protein